MKEHQPKTPAGSDIIDREMILNRASETLLGLGAGRAADPSERADEAVRLLRSLSSETGNA